MADYKKTLNLPDTPFPMRGDLPKREAADGTESRRPSMRDLDPTIGTLLGNLVTVNGIAAGLQATG